MPRPSRRVWRIWPATSPTHSRRARIPCRFGSSSGCTRPSLADGITHLAASTVAAKRRALERSLAAILAAPTSCDLARDIQNRFRRARDQLLTFADWPGKAEATNNGCERDLRPCVIQRKVTNGYRAMWAAEGEADIRSVVATARLKPGTGVFSTILQTVTA